MNRLSFDLSPDDGHYDVSLGSTFCGTLEVDVDGFYYYMPTPYKAGYYPGWFLKALGEKLEEINEPWDKELRDALALVPDEVIQEDALPEFNTN